MKSTETSFHATIDEVKTRVGALLRNGLKIVCIDELVAGNFRVIAETHTATHRIAARHRRRVPA